MNWRLLLCDGRREMLEDWRLQFAEMPEVELSPGDPLGADGDALLLPGNSFGFLDGGLELRVVETWGFEVQDAIRRAIRERFHGELLVGQALVVRLPGVPRAVVYAPIWRTPDSISGTVNVYLAARGAFLALDGEPSDPASPRRLVVPALGVGAPGELHPGVSARQLRYAWESATGRRGSGDKNLSQLARRQKKLQSVPVSLRREDEPDPA